NQAEYELENGDVCGFRKLAEQEGQLDLGLYYGKAVPEGAGTRLLFQGLFERFLGQRNVTVVRYAPLVCDECEYVQNREVVVRRIREGATVLFCHRCGWKNRLRAGEEIALSREDRQRVERGQAAATLRTRFETALVQVLAYARNQGKGSP